MIDDIATVTNDASHEEAMAVIHVTKLIPLEVVDHARGVKV
jgi:Mg/Co/Ni transporter MgtE